MTDLTLRRATMADAKLLWGWANDPEVRRASFTSEPIAWERHEAWLEAKLAAPDTRIWLLEHEGEPVGQVRYDREGDAADIGYSVAAPSRRQGFGTVILERSAPRACRELGVARLVGVVREGNEASCRAFVRAGFTAAGVERRGDAACIRYTWCCDERAGAGERDE